MAMSSENTRPEPIQITYDKGTDIGRIRDHNEDYVDAFIPPDPSQRRQKGDLFIVADGMGGHQAGEVASEGAVQMILHDYYTDPDPDVRGSLIRAIQKANTFVYEQAQQVTARSGMGTTVVAAVERGRELYLANVGDSRAYLMRQGQINQVTRDHSFVAEQIRAGILTPEEARAHPQRNVITRALGSKPEVEVDTYRHEFRPGDILLLCSDGLSEHVQEADMVRILGQYPPEEAVPRLIALANGRGGSDNISALVVRGAPPVSIAHRGVAAPAARPAAVPAPARRGLSLSWILGIGALALIAGAMLVAGAIFVPQLLGGKETAAPTEERSLDTLTAVTATPAIQATEFATPVSTPEATSTPAVRLSFQNPLDGATVAPGEVTFSWDLAGTLTGQIAVVVQSDVMGELCRTDQENSCDSPTLPIGDYKWWVEVLVDGEERYRSDEWTLHVARPTATDTPTPTLAPIPTEPPSGGDGDGKKSTKPPPR